MHDERVSLPPWPTRLWIIGGFFALTFLVYGTSLTHAFVRWDDGLLIYENPAIRAITPKTLWTIFTIYDPELFIPLTFFSYQLDYLVGGTHAAIYHVQNLLWHTLNALLVAWLILLLTKRRWTALLCGLLFAVHPLHTEAVAWASARKDVLSTFFFLASLIAYLPYRSHQRWKAYILSLGMFFLGLLAKVTVLTLPVVLLLLDFRQRRKWDRGMLLEKIPYFALSALFALIAWIGKTGVLTSSTLTEKLLMTPKSVMFSLEKIFAPVGLSVLYPFLGEVSLTRPDILIPLLSFTALIIVVFLSLKWTREVFFGIGFFLITVSPTLLNFAKGDTFYFASDRYAYVPSIGILLIVALGVVKLTEHFGWQRPALVASVALLLTLSGMSAAQSLTWKDSEALFSHALRLSPQAYVARVNLGNISRYRGETKDAITQYETALAILRTQGRPGRARDRSESKILSNLASALREDGNFPKAQQTNEQALILNPQNVYALLGLGIIAGQQGKAEDAEASYRRAITLDPEFAPAHLNLGALLVGAGRLEEGVSEYQEALRLNPFFPQAHYNLGVALGKLNRTREAEDAYREAVRLQPKFTAARINLGILLFNRKNVDEATEQFQAILQYDPSNTQARSAIQQIQRQ